MPSNVNLGRKSLLLSVGSILLLLVVALAVGYKPSAAESLPVSVTVDFDGLDDLGPGWAYEGWLIENGSAIAAGRFTVNSAGDLSETTFLVPVNNSADVSAYVLTIEPEPDADPGPSMTHLLGGSFSNKQANLTVGHATALGDDFTSASGSYILAAPSSSGSDGATYKNGIWWLDPTGPSASLNLPALPAGWAYEGWVAGMSGPVSTGVFSDTAAADSDGGGPAAGPNPAPPFPGQDFINPKTDLTAGYAAVISIEPSPDNSPDPFTLKPLLDGTIDDDGGGVLQMMSNNAAASSPTGMVELSDGHVVFLPFIGAGE